MSNETNLASVRSSGRASGVGSGAGRSTARSASWACALVATTAALCACSKNDPNKPSGPVAGVAEYKLATMSTLVEGADAQTVAAAAETALRARGLTISERRVTATRARLEAKAAGAAMLERTVVEARSEGADAVVKVRVEPLGDQKASAELLDAILVRMGR